MRKVTAIVVALRIAVICLVYGIPPAMITNSWPIARASGSRTLSICWASSQLGVRTCVKAHVALHACH